MGRGRGHAEDYPKLRKHSLDQLKTTLVFAESVHLSA
jgi:hypothetical protein